MLWLDFNKMLKLLIMKIYKRSWKMLRPVAAVQRCSYKKVFWRYAANLQEKTHAEVWSE